MGAKDIRTRPVSKEIFTKQDLDEAFEAGTRAILGHIMNDDLDYDSVYEGKKLLGEDGFERFYKWTQELGEYSKEEGRREVVEWLREYSIRGGKIPLATVIDDLETHSPYGRPSSRNGG